MIVDLLSRLPHLPISAEEALLLSALIVSLAMSLGALLRNRRLIASSVEDGADLGTVFENPTSLLPHLLELRTRLVNALVAIVAATLVSSLITEQFLIVLANPIGGLEALQAIRVTESFHVFFRIALTLGIVLASPYIIAQLWIFVAAGLRHTERRWFYLLFPFALALFLTGVGFAYIVMLPVAVPFLTTFMGIQTLPTLDDYTSFVTSILLWVGVSFEMPLVIFVLAKFKIVSAGLLARQWRIAIVAIAILSAIITPTPDLINMGLVAAPLFVLYLLSIILALFA
jgi:sec-independent protein translocase protein TatC